MHTEMHTEMLDSQVFGNVTLRHKNLRHDTLKKMIGLRLLMSVFVKLAKTSDLSRILILYLSIQYIYVSDNNCRYTLNI